MRRTFLCAALFLASGLISTDAFAQQTAAAPLPQDPAALMALAHAKNGLAGPDIRPWHIRGTYTFYDNKGKVERTGTYEEWWAGPGKYKRSFTSSQFSQTDYADGTHLFRDGDLKWADGKEMHVRPLLLNPLPDSELLKEFTLKRISTSAGSVKLDCSILTYPLRDNLRVSGDYFPAFCFGPDIPMLRVSSISSSHRVVYNKIALFQGHYIAKEIQESYGDKPTMKFSADVIEGLKEVPASLLTPPASAKPVDLNAISFVGDKHKTAEFAYVLKKVIPVYPQQAKQLGIQGTVHLRCVIAANGHVEKISVIDGPAYLRQAAQDSVSGWLYEPFTVLDRPVAVEIEVTVIFSLGR